MKSRVYKLNKNRYLDFLEKGLSDEDILKLINDKIGNKYYAIKII